MTFRVFIKTHPWRARLLVRLAWGSGWLGGTLVVPYGRLELRIDRNHLPLATS